MPSESTSSINILAHIASLFFIRNINLAAVFLKSEPKCPAAKKPAASIKYSVDIKNSAGCWLCGTARKIPCQAATLSQTFIAQKLSQGIKGQSEPLEPCMSAPIWVIPREPIKKKAVNPANKKSPAGFFLKKIISSIIPQL